MSDCKVVLTTPFRQQQPTRYQWKDNVQLSISFILYMTLKQKKPQRLQKKNPVFYWLLDMQCYGYSLLYVSVGNPNKGKNSLSRSSPAQTAPVFNLIGECRLLMHLTY